MPEPAARLTALLETDPVSLDRVMAVVASVAPGPPDEADVVGAFDNLAASLDPTAGGAGGGAGPTAAVVTHTFGTLGFAGNTADYYHPNNSFIHWVLRHRRGIPLTLAAVASEIGRRHGVELSIVGLPGHVILGDGPTPSRWFDPFAGGAELDLEGCRRLFAQFHDLEAFDQSMLAPIEPTAITTRMLTNLKLVYRQQGDIGQLARVLDLAVAVPGSALTERYELAAVLTGLGRTELAADQHELLITLDPARAEDHRRAVHRLRARRN